MKLETGFFRSRFAQRLFAIFILSAIIPIITLGAITFNRVSEQLVEQNSEQQRREVKSLGLAIYERMVLLQAELELLTSLPDISASPLLEDESNIRTQIEGKFENIGLANRKGEFFPLPGFMRSNNRAGLPAELIDAMPTSSLHLAEDDTDQLRIFISYPSSNVGFIVGEISREYLWESVDGIDISNDICILGHTNDVLYCSANTPLQLRDSVAQVATESFSGGFEWTDENDEDFLLTYWGIFLNDQFSVDDWTVLISVPKQTVLRPVIDFQNTFLLVFAITVLLVIMLSSTQIRRILTPLRKLTAGIQDVGNSNFDSRVEIDSNDEFSDLADSFNTMGTKLADQFNSLETMAEIDRLILSSQDAENIVKVVLVRIHDIIRSDQIGIIAQNSEGEFNKLFIRAKDTHSEDEVQEIEIELSPDDFEFLHKNKQGTDLILDHTTPLFLEPLTLVGANSCLVLPLFFDDTLSAVVILGYKELPHNVEQLLQETRGWGDRMAVALSNAKWQEKLYNQANYDTLTGLPNRPAFRTYLQQALDRAERNEEMVGVLFIDLDRFKLVNDTLGHAAGDSYLKEIADRLSSCVRSTDMLARLGGDEFTIVVSESPNYHHIKTSISAIADKLLGMIPMPIEVEGQELRSNASVGISIYPLDANNLEDLMKNADSAMYHAKANGGGNYHYYSEELNQVISEQLRVENELRMALQRNEFELYFQPQMNAHSEKMIGAEALIRWNHPKAELIAPDNFIPLAEETQLIVDIDLWVLNAACAQLKLWEMENRPEVMIAVNLSAKFFKQEEIATQLMRILNKHGVEPKLLELEITEGSLIEDIESAQALLEELTRLGFQLTIDDFGTGYSSLSYLKRLAIHKLKIDQSFVDKCAFDSVDGSLVKTIISMAQNLNLACIAEGVETSDQLEFLKQHGCTEIQGFYFSKPLPAKSFASYYLIED